MKKKLTDQIFALLVVDFKRSKDHMIRPTNPDQFAFDMPDIFPVRFMADPYKPCWCGSGKKWKWCHKNRDAQPPIATGKVFHEMLQKSKEGTCFHPDAPGSCSSKIIRSHTVQKRGGLKAISENGHVLSVRDSHMKRNSLDDELMPRLVGINDASTFLGFCEKHDGEFFAPIEKGEVVLDDKAMFLLAFRAVCYEILNKKHAIAWHDINRELDRGKTFEVQAEIQTTFHYLLQGSKIALEDGKVWKSNYDKATLDSDLSSFWHYSVVFDRLLPFVACGGIAPEYDFNGKVSQSLMERSDQLEHIAVNVTSFGGKTLVSLGWLGSPDGPAVKFIRSFANLQPEAMANSVLRLLFEHIENTFLLPSWWEGLPREQQLALTARQKNGTLSGERHPNCLLPDAYDYLPGCEVDSVISRLP